MYYSIITSGRMNRHRQIQKHTLRVRLKSTTRTQQDNRTIAPIVPTQIGPNEHQSPRGNHSLLRGTILSLTSRGSAGPGAAPLLHYLSITDTVRRISHRYIPGSQMSQQSVEKERPALRFLCRKQPMESQEFLRPFLSACTQILVLILNSLHQSSLLLMAQELSFVSTFVFPASIFVNCHDLSFHVHVSAALKWLCMYGSVNIRCTRTVRNI